MRRHLRHRVRSEGREPGHGHIGPLSPPAAPYRAPAAIRWNKMQQDATRCNKMQKDAVNATWQSERWRPAPGCTSTYCVLLRCGRHLGAPALIASYCVLLRLIASYCGAAGTWVHLGRQGSGCLCWTCWHAYLSPGYECRRLVAGSREPAVSHGSRLYCIRWHAYPRLSMAHGCAAYAGTRGRRSRRVGGRRRGGVGGTRGRRNIRVARDSARLGQPGWRLGLPAPKTPPCP